jgi:CubicO group peptidase (beta-lactamase class C family)
LLAEKSNLTYNRQIALQMKFRNAFLAIFLLSMVQPRGYAQSKAQNIDKLISKYFSYGQFNGVALVAEHDKVILNKGYGYANFEWKVPNTPDTKFRIGSVTKTFTDVLAFQQIEKGKLRLDGFVSDYLRDYPQPQGHLITIYHLMTHTSGLADYDEMDIEYSLFYPHEKILAMFDSLPLKFKPGSQFSYTNSGAFLLGVILEKVTGKTYEQLLNENILRPLALKNTGYDHQNSVLKNRASGYKVFGPQPLHDAYIDMSIPYAAYAMYSTSEDLFQWSRALYTDKLISKKGMDQYFKPFRETWACDWVVLQNPFSYATDTTVMDIRGGSISGFVCFVARTSDKNCIVLLDNTASAQMEEMVQNITAILYDKPFRQPKRSLQKAFTKLVNEQGMVTALSEIRKLKKDTANYSCKPAEFLRMANIYRFELNDLSSAIRVLELIREFYPGNFNRYGDNSAIKDSFNIYGALGDTYLKNGEKEKAIECLKKAVELNPNDVEAIQALKKLETK